MIVSFLWIPFHSTNIILCWHNMNWAKAVMRIWKKKKEATHPLRRLYGVTSRDGRKDCNNRDSLAHRMRGPIKAGGEETLGLISVRECPPPLSICCSGERQQAVYLFSPSFNTNRPMDRPDKILLSHPSTPVFLVLSGRYLDWQE